MAKKKNNAQVGNIMYVLAAILGVVAVCMLFVTAFVVKDAGTGAMDASYTGFQTVFGYASEDVTYLKFSFMNLLPYVFVLAAVVLVVLKLVGVAKSKLIDWVSVILLVVAGVFFFLTANFTVLTEDYTDLIKVANLVKTYVTTGLGAGPIVAGICSILSGVTVAAKNLLKK